jgi:ligand-binding sensor domain-containing protein
MWKPRCLRPVGLLATGLAAIAGAGGRARAEQLPIRHYGIADGYTGSNTLVIYQDSKGYLWFGSDDGLSRFDGDRFVAYGIRDGLGHPAINVIAEDREARLWVGTNGGGVARLSEEGGAHRTSFAAHRVHHSRASNQVNNLAFEADGTLWCLTDGGLFRADPASLNFEAVLSYPPTLEPGAMLVDIRGRIWAGIDDELMLLQRGKATSSEPPAGVVQGSIRALVEDPPGRILVATDYDLYEYGPAAAGANRGSWRRLPLELGPTQKIRSMWAGPDGVLWIATSQGLIKYATGRQSVYTTAHGLRSDVTFTVLGDREGSLWVGTNAGPARLQGLDAVSWTKADGLPDETIHKVIEAQDGRIYVYTPRGGVAEIVGGKAAPIEGSTDPPFQAAIDGMPTQILQDRHGDWWVTSRISIHRFSGPRLQFRHGRGFEPSEGIPEGIRFSGGTYGIHEDTSGRLWIGSPRGLYRFDPSKPTIPMDLLPLVGSPHDEVCDLVADHSGRIWVMTHVEVSRVTEDGGWEKLLPAVGDSASTPLALFVDLRGWLWVGLRHGGVWMTSEPGASRPRWRNYSTADGLTSDRIQAIAEDHLGRIHLGTPKGIDRLEPETGRVRSFTSRDGLVGDFVNHVLVDRHGYVWVGTRTGLTRFNPRLETRLGTPPAVYLTRVQVAGEELWLPERGVREIPSLPLGPSRNSLLIEFVAPSFRSEGLLRYQYRLEGADAEWSAPSEERAVNYARLGPGSYRFLVRAVTAEGQASGEPASFAFEISPPHAAVRRRHLERSGYRCALPHPQRWRRGDASAGHAPGGVPHFQGGGKQRGAPLRLPQRRDRAQLR